MNQLIWSPFHMLIVKSNYFIIFLHFTRFVNLWENNRREENKYTYNKREIGDWWARITTLDSYEVAQIHHWVFDGKLISRSRTILQNVINCHISIFIIIKLISESCHNLKFVTLLLLKRIPTRIGIIHHS